MILQRSGGEFHRERLNMRFLFMESNIFVILGLDMYGTFLAAMRLSETNNARRTS
jgi:hypothetical protein